MDRLKVRMRPLFRNERFRVLFSSLSVCIFFVVGWVTAICGFLALLYVLHTFSPAGCKIAVWGTDGTYSVSPSVFLEVRSPHVL